MTAVFAILVPIGSLFFNNWFVFITLVPEIFGPIVGLFFTKMYYLTVFKHFVSIFSLIFDPFHDRSFLQNISSDWVHFILLTEPGYQTLDEVPPPNLVAYVFF